MKKIILLLIIVFTASLCGYAKTLEGGITYTVDSARTILFDNAPGNMPEHLLKSYYIDPDYRDNKDFIKYGINPEGKNLTVFKKGKLKIAYAVTYKDMKEFTFYYLKLGGALAAVDVLFPYSKNQKEKYPLKVYKYNNKGKLLSAGFQVSENEAFLYNKDKKLIIHLINDTGYDEHGKKQWTSEEVAF